MTSPYLRNLDAASPAEAGAVSDLQRASTRAVEKPWGTNVLRSWSDLAIGSKPVGELWFDIPHPAAPNLLLKLLFTEQQLSVQVHPGDVFARSMGLPNGKSEAWYVLDAKPGAQVAIGLKQSMTADALRAAIADETIVDLIAWRDVVAGDVVFIPAGTIHAIGPGLVIAEIQQRSDTTFRMYDFGRGRALDIENAIAVADAGPPASAAAARVIDQRRTVLVDSPMLVIERLDVRAGEHLQLCAEGETWVMTIRGSLKLDEQDLPVGEVAYLSRGSVHLRPNGADAVALVSYPGPHRASLMIDPSPPLEVFA